MRFSMSFCRKRGRNKHELAAQMPRTLPREEQQPGAGRRSDLGDPSRVTPRGTVLSDTQTQFLIVASPK